MYTVNAWQLATTIYMLLMLTKNMVKKSLNIRLPSVERHGSRALSQMTGERVLYSHFIKGKAADTTVTITEESRCFLYRARSLHTSS